LVSRYLIFRSRPGGDPQGALKDLSTRSVGDDVFGIGAHVVDELGGHVPGLRASPALAGPGVAVPSTPIAVWCWLRGDDRGQLMHRGREIRDTVAAGFAVEQVVDGFRYDGGRDLTGYEDGTENPEGERARAVAVSEEAGLEGSSFVAVQQWTHELDRFAALDAHAQDETIGRRRADNEEIGDAPPSAHVKRTAQESFDPEAFIVRRSVPWSDPTGEGLVFVAFGRTFDAFEALLRRMVGLDDGITDALFRFTRPVTSSYLWCPPVSAEGCLDLSALRA
jgi:putative iron-dependent peroxidase